jgi:hypothetical protein
MSTTETERSENVAQFVEKRFPKSKLEAVLSVFLLVSKLPLIYQLLLASIGLALAIFCGAMLLTKLFNNQNSLARTLPATLVSTAYPHRGVTAFLTARLDEKAESEKNNKELSGAIGKIADHIKNLNSFYTGWDKKVIQSLDETVEAERNSNERSATVSKPAAHVTNPKTPEKDWEDKLIEYLELEIRDKSNVPSNDEDRTWTQIIYSKHMEKLGRPAFLMVPAISLRQTEVGPNGLKGHLREDLRHNPEILFDFYIASQIQKELDDLGTLPHQPLKIVQAYFISESGVILLRQLPNSRSYEETFPNNTLFMDRLYFWGAINPVEFRQDKNNLGPLDYETEPYIDLGGNGVVKTNSKRVELPNRRTGVICVDVVLPNTQDQIINRLQELDGIVATGQYVESSVNSDGKSNVRLEASAADSGFDWVNLTTTPSSRITGAIAFEEDFRLLSDPNVVRFTVPMGGNARNGETVTNLLLVTFYFPSNKKWISFYTAGLVVGIGFFIFVMGNIIFQITDLTKKMNQVLVNMSEVMYYATTPFVWLNENNEFEEANVSFLNMVECDTKTDLKNHAPRFKDLVAPESLPIYEEKLARSAKDHPTPMYWIEIVTAKKHKKISVLAHGERIPYPTLGRKRAPHRFGVFLPESADLEKRQSHLDKIDAGDAEESGTAVPSEISD